MTINGFNITFRVLDPDARVVYEWDNPEPASVWQSPKGWHAQMALQIPPQTIRIELATLEVLVNDRLFATHPIRYDVPDGTDIKPWVVVEPTGNTVTVQQEIVIS